MPHENSTFSTNWDQSFLIGGDLDLGDVTWMSNTSEVADSLIVVPEFDSLVLASRNEMLTSFSDSQGIDFSSFGSIKHSDGLTIEAIPVSDLSVWASGQNLRFIWVVEDLLEHGWLEQAHNSGVVDDIPDNAWTIIGCWNGLGVLLVDFDVWDSTSVFLKWALHDLSLSTNSPHSDFTFHTSGDNLLAVAGSSNSSNTVIMGIVDGEEQFTWLWEESSNLTIIPTREDAFAIGRELDAEALESRNFNS